MPFPIAAALAVFQTLQNSGKKDQPPGFQIPQFNPGLRALIQSRSPIMSSMAGSEATGDATFNEDPEKKDKTSTKDYITQAFLGTLIHSAFGQQQQSPYTFAPPSFH